ncbi:uncharacterized protein [Dermacentor andersoni]|uniref:uncharacterized protein n=1 Tax=Dermacentor andersoni TaxID=34620 RepID=UPI002417C513|nr:uncharacterized protein LOC126518106 [Dermacentor andersoni]XP_054921407.1 uncharacterized protein LOC126519823 [Dermacentor andersoni]
MAISKLHDLPQEYLQYMVDIMQKEGHHYFYHGRRCCLLNLWMPVGTIGVYTCALVNNTKENWIELTHANGSKTSHHFSHEKLPKGTLLHYTIRISFTKYIVSCDFDKTIAAQESEKPNYINANFSEALNIINFDVDVPYT